MLSWKIVVRLKCLWLCKVRSIEFLIYEIMMIYIDLFLTRSSLFWVILEIFLQTLRTRPKFVGIYVIYEYLFISMCIYTFIDISLNIHNSKISRTDSYMKCRKNWCTKNIFKGSRLQISLLILTISWRRLLTSRNQSIDLRSKSMDWFPYDNGLRHERVKRI